MYRLLKNRNTSSIDYKIAFSIMMLWSTVSFVLTVHRETIIEGFDYDYKYSFCWCAISPGGLLFSTVLVMCVALVAVASVLNDKNDQVLSVIMCRGEFIKYLLYKALSIASVVFRIVAIPLIINFLLCYFFLPHNEYSPYWADRIYREGFILGRDMMYNAKNPVLPNIKLFLRSPDLYAVSELCLVVCFTVIFGLFLAFIAFFFRKGRTAFIVIPVIVMQLLARHSSTLLDKAAASSDYVYVNYNLGAYFDPIGYAVSGLDFKGLFLLMLLMIISVFAMTAVILKMREKYLLA